MLVKVYENWARLEDNGIWANPPRIVSTLQFFKTRDYRAKLIDEVIFICPKYATYTLCYKIRLSDYTERVQNNIIDTFLPILI